MEKNKRAASGVERHSISGKCVILKATCKNFHN